MSHEPLPNYLRACRKALGLTQRDVAYLLGCHDGTNVSRYERFVREPSLHTAIACEVIFGVSCRDLFPAIAYEAQARVRARTDDLVVTIGRQRPSSQVARRMSNLQLLAERCGHRKEAV